MKRKDRAAFDRELEKRYEEHLANLNAAKLEGRRVTVFVYDVYRTAVWRKHQRPIIRHLRNLFFELQNGGPGPLFDSKGHELTFEITTSGTLYVWRHPKRKSANEE
jgi:hypothetical protein